MHFDELDRRMRVFEMAHDHRVLPGIQMVARIDGRDFTRLTKETLAFERPYDEHFRDQMLATAEHLMTCGFNVLYGYTQSDEISLLFHPAETAFDRKLRKFNSILAGEASARFSLLVGVVASFDCRISQLPRDDLVVDYFRWRQEDAHRNALNGYCYWTLRDTGISARAVHAQLAGLSVAQKNELLFSHGINFNNLPAWQRRGAGLFWETYEKQARNPKTGETGVALRRRLRQELDLPMRDDYARFIREILAAAVPT